MFVLQSPYFIGGFISVERQRNIKENKKPQRIFWVGPKYLQRFHQLVASKPVIKNVAIIAKGVAIIAIGIAIISPRLQRACSGLNQQLQWSQQVKKNCHVMIDSFAIKRWLARQSQALGQATFTLPLKHRCFPVVYILLVITKTL